MTEEQPRFDSLSAEECLDYVAAFIKRLTEAGCTDPRLEGLRRDHAHLQWRCDNSHSRDDER
jgi:hypothetical protein